MTEPSRVALEIAEPTSTTASSRSRTAERSPPRRGRRRRRGRRAPPRTSRREVDEPASRRRRRRRPSRQRRPSDSTSRRDEPEADVDPVEEFRAALRRAARRLVRRALLRGLREPREDQPRDTAPSSLNMEDYIFQIEVPHARRSSRSRTASARWSGAQVPARLRPGPHGAHRRVVGGGAQHARRDRLRRPRPPRRRRCTIDEVVAILAPEQEKKEKVDETEGAAVDFEVGESVTVMDGPFATLPAIDQRDQRRRAEAQGAGRRSSAGRPRSSCRSARSQKI